jgi:bifunctional non-homologous end joining protein LigD
MSSRLETYRGKRHFEKTAEPEGAPPRGRARKRAPGGVFVIHKHAARRLHFDLRLEMDGMFKSWAVPKGPSVDPGVRRLAVHVEDHPIEYGTFEGVIPKGEYGAGTVMLWDAGRWDPVGDAEAGYRRGELKFSLAGRRLHGAWVLVRMNAASESGEGAGDGKDWLLIKERDEAAEPGVDDLWGADDRSVTSLRTMKEIAEAAPPAKQRRPSAARRPTGAGRNGPPQKAALSLATLVDEPPEGDEWLHEIKFDGYRILARVSAGDVTLLTRNGLDWTARFPTLAAELSGLEVDSALLDGEVVAEGPDGRSDFGALQRALSESDDATLDYMVFDLLYVDGVDTRRLPLAERKARLADLLRSGLPSGSRLVRVSEHVAGHGATFYAEACRLGLEGVVSKRADAGYPGRRSRTWLKSKCVHRQEFVVGGYTDPAGSRAGFGALLLGVHDAGGDLRYAGKVGSGFTDDGLKRLATRLRALARVTPPFDGAVKERGTHWVTPKLVAEVAFSGWTTDGRLRHPVFKGLREDKAASAVRRETAPEAVGHPAPDAPGKSKGQVSAAGVRISHPERVVYPDLGMTKLEVVA